jgi:hypothetical protein
MRCTQPFIPTSGRLGKQFIGFHFIGISNSDFYQDIGSKYSGLKLGKLNFPTLILLQRSSNDSSVINMTQVLKTQIISGSPLTANLSLNLNLVFWNKAVREFVVGFSQPESQGSLLKILTVAQNTSTTKTLLREFTQPVNIELRRQERSLYQPTLPFQPKTTEERRPLLFQQQRAVEISTPFNFQSIITEETRPLLFQQQRVVEILTSLRPQSATTERAKPLILQQLRAAEIPTPFRPQPKNVTPQPGNLPLGKPDSQSQPDYPTLVNRTQKFVHISSTNISRIISTAEQTSFLIQRLQNVETQSLIQHKKAVTHSFSFNELGLAPNHIRIRELKKSELNKLSPSFETDDFVFQQQFKNLAGKKQSNYQSYPVSSKTVMEFVQPKANSPTTPTNQESMAEMKKGSTKRRQGDVNMPTIDVNRLAEQVYEVIERKIKIERQRRGIL